MVLTPRHSLVAHAASVPAGLPAHFGIGLAAHPDSTGLTGWMPNSGIPWDYAYQYLSGGANTGSGWATWNSSGQFPLYYAQSAASHGYTPVFSYYQLLQSTGTCASTCSEAQKDLSNLNNPSLMASYFADFRLLMQRLGAGTSGGITGYGKTAIVQVEPDLSGYAQQAVLNTAQCSGYCTAQGNNPSYLTASVASSGDPDVQGLPNTYQGFNWALLHLRDLYAPNVLLAVHASDWATGSDISSDHSTTLDATALGQQVGSFINQSGIASVPAGSSTYDLVFNDVADRDAGLYKYSWGNPNTWWDRTNTVFPNFSRWESYISAIHGTTNRSLMIWQIPIGNQYFDTENNTAGHWQDNRAEYFFGHISELANVGIIGLLFGSGGDSATVQFDATNDGVTNPASTCTTDGTNGTTQICNTHTSTVADDDGGYLRMQGQAYYANPYPLPGSTSSTATPVPSATSTSDPTAVSTATPSPSATSTPAPTSTATPTASITPAPTATNTPSPTATAARVSGVVIGNFENTTDGFSRNSVVSSVSPSTAAGTVALGSYSLSAQYSITQSWAEAQIYKVADLNLSGYSTLSASVFAKQPTAAGAGVKVRFMVLGSDNHWYNSAYQTIPLGTRTTVSWALGTIPRAPVHQVYVCWQFTTSAKSTGNQLWVDAVEAS